MVRCAYCGFQLKSGCGRTSHKFPLNDIFNLELWIKNMKLPDFTPNKHSRLCSSHFEENCLDRSSFSVRLKKDSIPTIFNDSVSHCLCCGEKRTLHSKWSFFRFPLKKPDLLRKWLENISKNENLLPNENSILCSKHFEVSCFRKIKGKYLVLKENSVPTMINATARGNDNKIKEEIHHDEGLIFTSEEPKMSFKRTRSEICLPVSDVPSVSNSALQISNANKDAIDCNTIKTLGPSRTEEVAPILILSPLHEWRRSVDHDHSYSMPPKMVRRRYNECNKILEIKKSLLKMQSRKILLLKRRVKSLKNSLTSRQFMWKH